MISIIETQNSFFVAFLHQHQQYSYSHSHCSFLSLSSYYSGYLKREFSYLWLFLHHHQQYCSKQIMLSFSFSPPPLPVLQPPIAPVLQCSSETSGHVMSSLGTLTFTECGGEPNSEKVSLTFLSAKKMFLPRQQQLTLSQSMFWQLTGGEGIFYF